MAQDNKTIKNKYIFDNQVYITETTNNNTTTKQLKIKPRVLSVCQCA